MVATNGTAYIYDLAIIGGGPAGVSAGVYAARKKLKTAFITKEWGGQSTVSDDIQNWIGTPHISGKDLATSLEKHLEEYAADSVELFPNSWVTSVTKNADGTFSVTYDHDGKTFTITSHTILLCVGSSRRKLSARNADMFEHKGLTYCASCDGPLFTDRDVVVVGGGNAAFETAAQLLAYCKSVTLLNRTDTFKADPVTVEKVSKHPNMKVILNADITEVYGSVFVEGIKYMTQNATQDKRTPDTGLEHTLATDGVFVEIGLIPNTGFLGTLVPLNEYKQVVIDPWTQKTGTPGIWAAGDCTNILYHQNNIASGDAVRALEDIFSTLKT